MKKLLLLVVILWNASCVSINNKQVSEKGADTLLQKPLILTTWLDDFLSKHSDCFDNDIKTEEAENFLAVDFLLSQLGDSIDCVTQIPVKFNDMLKYNNNKYLLKFVADKYTTDLKLSDKYDASLTVLAFVDKKTASQLVEGKLYFIDGSCHSYADSKHLQLPSGAVFNLATPSLKKSAFDGVQVDLGILLVTDLTFRPATDDEIFIGRSGKSLL